MAAGKKAVGERIKAAIARRGLTQSEFARRLGVKHTTFSNWVNGATEAPYEQLVEICRLLDTSADELLGLPPRGPARLSKEQAHELLQILERVRRSRDESGELLEDLQTAFEAAVDNEARSEKRTTKRWRYGGLRWAARPRLFA